MRAGKNSSWPKKSSLLMSNNNNNMRWLIAVVLLSNIHLLKAFIIADEISPSSPAAYSLVLVSNHFVLFKRSTLKKLHCYRQYRHVKSPSYEWTIPYCPDEFFLCILQERVHKKSELRVILVGERVFAAEIDSHSNINAQDDLHRSPIVDLPKKPIQLDDVTTDGCLKIMKTLDLKYGAIDLILDLKDQVHFLEINPTGEWCWIEHQTNLPITDAMVELIGNLASLT